MGTHSVPKLFHLLSLLAKDALSPYTTYQTFPRWRERPKTARNHLPRNRHVLLRVAREINMSHDWFRCAFIVNVDICQMFAKAIAQSAFHFADEYFLHKVHVMQ